MKLKEILKNKTGRIISIVLVAVIVATVGIIAINTKKAKVDTQLLINTIEKSSELTTSKLTITGYAEYTDTGISFLTKSDFKMLYKANVRIGIDIEDVKIDKNIVNKKIVVNIPKAEVLDVKILQGKDKDGKDNLRFFDEKFALFNVNEKEDLSTVLALAEESAIKEVEEMGSLKMADEQSAVLIKGILANAIPNGYEIVVKQQGE